MICPKTKSATHRLSELFPIYQNKHWTIRQQDDRSVDPSSHRIILKIVGFLVHLLCTQCNVKFFRLRYHLIFVFVSSSFIVLCSVISNKDRKCRVLLSEFKNYNSKILGTQVASTVRKRNDFTTPVLLLVGPKGSGAQLKKDKAICLTTVFWSFSQKPSFRNQISWMLITKKSERTKFCFVFFSFMSETFKLKVS